MTIAAIIATRFEPPQLKPLLETLRADGVWPVVMADSGPHPEDWSLYTLWNAGIRYALERDAEYICVMNDDVAILPGALTEMARVLDETPEIGVVYPNPRRNLMAGIDPAGDVEMTTGSWGSGGMTGFCFMFRADLDIPFDEGYSLWYGDDAFEEAVRAKGLLVARIDGLPIDHHPDGSTSRLPEDEMARRIHADRARWSARLVPA